MPTQSFHCASTNGVAATTNGVGHRSGGWPEDVGILAIDLYFPHQYVDQVRRAVFIRNNKLLIKKTRIIAPW
jgi:hypothetical protein